VTTVVCLALPHANGYLGGILAIAAGVTAGAALATISGLLKAKWNTDELITSFLLSAAVSLIVDSFITGPLDDPNNSLLTTRAVGGQFRLPGIFPPSKLSAGAFIAVAMAVIVFLFIYRSHWGYEMRTCGLNREFARYGGINVAAYLVTPMAASGALHGAAGGIAILGTYGACLKGFSAGMGWNGIAVALIAKNNPIGVLPAALFFAYLDAGAKAAMLHSDVTFEIAALAQSAIFYLVTAQALYGALRGRKRKVA
jgi:simple sugar transport system permease protein